MVCVLLMIFLTHGGVGVSGVCGGEGGAGCGCLNFLLQQHLSSPPYIIFIYLYIYFYFFISLFLYFLFLYFFFYYYYYFFFFVPFSLTSTSFLDDGLYITLNG